MHCQIGNFWTRLTLVPVSSAGSQSPLEALFLLPLPRTRSEPLSRALQSFQETSAGPLRKDFRFPGLRKNRFSLERCSKIVTFAISAQAASSELQNPSKMVSETLSELPKTLPRAPREVPGASRRPLRSGPRRFQRHLSSARDLRSTLEAALKAFRDRFWCKLRAPSLLFFLFSCPWPLPPRRLLEPSRTALGRFRLAFGAPVD